MHPDVTFSPTAQAYAVVWVGDHDIPSHADNELEVIGRLILPLSGAAVAPQQRLTHAGPNGDFYYNTRQPVITTATFNGDTQLFVAWQQTDEQSEEHLLAPHVSQIRARTFTAATPGAGFLPSSAELQLSDIEIAGGGPEGLNADVAYSPVSDLFLVVWEEPEIVPSRSRIAGQFLDGAGRETIDNDLDLTTSSIFRNAERPRVAWNSARDHFLVVFEGEDPILDMGEGESEIFSVAVRSERDPLTGNYAGECQRISHMGADGSSLYGAHVPSLAYNADDDEFLVVWHADDDSLGRGHDDFEVHCQRLDGGGTEIGPDDTRVSAMQPPSGSLDDVDFTAAFPRVAYNRTTNEYLVVYHGSDWVNGARRPGIYHTRVSSNGIVRFPTDKLIHQGSTSRHADVDYSPERNEFFLVWQSDGAILGRRLAGAFGEPLGATIILSTGEEAEFPASSIPPPPRNT